MADILRFPGNLQKLERSEDTGAIGLQIARSIDAVVRAARTKRLTINLQLDPDVAASNSHPDFQPAIAETLANAIDRAPNDSVIDILGSRSDTSIEIEVSDLGDGSHIAINNSMHRPYKRDAVVKQCVRIPQGGNSTILRICRPLAATAAASDGDSNSSVSALRKVA